MHLEICITIVSNSRVLKSSQGTGHYLSPKAVEGGLAEDLGLDKVKFSRSLL